MEKGYATLALNERRMDDLIEMEKASHATFGYDKMQLWDKAKLKQHLGSDIYVGGLYDSNSGHLHPLNYCLGLSKSLLRFRRANLRTIPSCGFSGKIRLH